MSHESNPHKGKRTWVMTPVHEEKEKMNHEPDLFDETYSYGS